MFCPYNYAKEPSWRAIACVNLSIGIFFVGVNGDTPNIFAVGTDVDLDKFHNIPWDPALVPHDVINYNSRLASHLWVKMFKNGVEILNSRVAGSPSASTTNCMYLQYDFVGTSQENVVCNITWRMYEGSYTVDFLQQFISFILGITTYPTWYGTDSDNSFMLHLPSIPYDSH